MAELITKEKLRQERRNNASETENKNKKRKTREIRPLDKTASDTRKDECFMKVIK